MGILLVILLILALTGGLGWGASRRGVDLTTILIVAVILFLLFGAGTRYGRVLVVSEDEKKRIEAAELVATVAAQSGKSVKRNIWGATATILGGVWTLIQIGNAGIGFGINVGNRVELLNALPARVTAMEAAQARTQATVDAHTFALSSLGTQLKAENKRLGDKMTNLQRENIEHFQTLLSHEYGVVRRKD